jgi:hypothetical protein
MEDISVQIVAETGEVVHGKLQTLSTTGGCVLLPVVVSPDTAAEVAIKCRFGRIHGIAHMYSPVAVGGRKSQGFRFIALDDDDHRRLKQALDSLPASA